MPDMNRNIYVSTRVRLARNLQDYPFPDKLTVKGANEITDQVAAVMHRFGKFNLYRLKDLSDTECVSLKERYLISNDLLKNRKIASVILNEEETVSIMINEEDHIRAQCLLHGLDLKNAYSILSEIDSALTGSLKIAFDRNLGFLTSCPTNLGTAMRASVMLFIPALTRLKQIGSIINESFRINLAIRGVYGEGTEPTGYLFQVSNQTTLGISEYDLIKSVQEMVLKICEHESEARKILKSRNDPDFIDSIMRSYGILTNAYKLTSEEFMNGLSDIKLGGALGYVPQFDPMTLDNLMLDVCPATMMVAKQKQMTALERDIERAKMVKQTLKSTNVLE